jgi:hypothetical protein
MRRRQGQGQEQETARVLVPPFLALVIWALTEQFILLANLFAL